MATTEQKTAVTNESEATAETLQDALIVLVVDRSGSMETIQKDMQGGITTLLAEQAKLEGRCFVTLAQFDDQYEVVADRTLIEDLEPYRLVPRGSTALLDAIGRTIGSTKAWMESLPESERPRVLFVVVTDGYENASREWSRLQVMDSVKARISEGWDFTFLGANQDAIAEGATMGFDPGSSLTFDRKGAESAVTALERKMVFQRSAPTMDDSYAFSESERVMSAPSENRRSRKKKA